ncbi:polysaccharide lyase family 7 protein [Reichenbachiella agarivorans]|uniref:Polysaccharide lyase family 7 protein n=1 Tax=Reichenbachiella agarivorans TaxID=2979464 RepID=A0ABY6CRX5_9BACT|nr:polysaccharide lyase family 7 protein [Reichenbachiella agarivorans]UXP33094.1 polysaccharide lyase family 7 protein [Reichenbachiella agarivorans]
MKQYLILLSSIICILFLVLTGCKEDEGETQELLSDAKQIETFVFDEFDPIITGTITADHTIEITVPYGTDLTSIVPSINISNLATVSPESGVSQDFTNPVSYTVTAEDGTTQIYVVTAVISLNDAKEITSFIFNELDPVSSAYIEDGEIKAWVQVATDVTNLVPTIVTSDNATVSPLSGVGQDFSTPVTYTVTAEDGTTQTYTVTVVEEMELDVDSGPAFNWINWYLSVPIGTSGATSIYYEDIENDALSDEASEYFYLNEDDSYTMYTKFTGQTTSGVSGINGGKYCRTELREYWRGNQNTNDNWFMDGKSSHAMASTLKVDFCNGIGQTYVAQIHGKSTFGVPGDPATVKVLWDNGELLIEYYRKPTQEGDEWTSKYIFKKDIGQVDNEIFTIKLKVQRGVLYYALHCEAKDIDTEYVELYDYAANGYVHHNYFKTGNYFKWNSDMTEDSQVTLYSVRTAHN